MSRVLVFGETLWDLFPAGAQLGGAPCNFALRLRALGHDVTLATRLGRDELGRRAAERLATLGPVIDSIQWDDVHPTGTVPVKVDAKGSPDFTIVPNVAYDFIEATPALLEAAGGADAVCFGTLAQRAPTSRATLARLLDAAPGALKVLDLNLRRDCHTEETVLGSLERAGILKLNEDEAAELARRFGLSDPSIPAFCDGILERFPLSHVVVTLGSRGSFGASREGPRVYVPGLRVETLVDTCGSGDAFTAGFVHEFLAGKRLGDCLERGNILGALVAGQEGATTPLPADAAVTASAVSDPVLDRFRAP